MSLILAFVYWVLIPAVVVLAAWRLWRLASSALFKGLVVAVSAAGLVGLLWLAEGEKWLLDRQVRVLCAQDGGVKVYETVKLPAEKFDQWGQPNFSIPVTPYNKLRDADEYYLEWEITNIKRGNPSLKRNHFRLIRRSDKKLLGESVSYSRGGGDLPGPWADSSFSCSDIQEETPLFTHIFIK